MEKAVGSFLIDIGQDSEFAVGEEVLLDIALYSTKDDKPTGLAEFSSAELRVFSGARVQFDTTIMKTETTKVFANFLPTDPGHWTLAAEFFRDDVSLAGAEFPIEIGSLSANPEPAVPTQAVFAGLVTLLGIASYGMYFMHTGR